MSQPRKPDLARRQATSDTVKIGIWPRIHVLLFLAFALLSVFWNMLPGVALATPPSPVHDYTIETANKKYVLVLLVPEGEFQGPLPVDPQIRDRYPRSGLYTQTGALLWSLDWYLLPGRGDPRDQVFPLNDGEHLITWTEPGAESVTWTTRCDAVAVAIWEHGKKLRSYRVGDLATCPGKMQFADSGAMWLNSFTISQPLRLLLLAGYDNRITLISTATGKILISAQPFFLLIGVGALGLAGYAFVVLRQKHAALRQATPKAAGDSGRDITGTVLVATYRTCPTCYKLIADPTLVHCLRCGTLLES